MYYKFLNYVYRIFLPENLIAENQCGDLSAILHTNYITRMEVGEITIVLM